MALNIEKRQVSLIDSASFNNARAVNVTPDLSGLQRLANAFLNQGADAALEKKNNDKQNQALADSSAGYADANTNFAATGKDENGNWVTYNPDPTKSPHYNKSRMDATDQLIQNQFYTGINEGFNELQTKFIKGEIDAPTMQKAMQARMEGMLKTFPPAMQADLQRYGTTEMMGRIQVAAGQQAAIDNKRQNEELKTIATNRVTDATNQAAIGGDPSLALNDANTAIDNFAKLNPEIGPEQIAAMKKDAAEKVATQSMVMRVNKALAEGKITPDQADQFATAIATPGVSAKITTTSDYKPGPGFGSNPTQGPGAVVRTYDSEEIKTALTDPQKRAAASAEIQRHVQQIRQVDKELLKYTQYKERFDFLSSPAGDGSVIDGEDKTLFNKSMEVGLSQVDLSNPAARTAVVGQLAAAKVMPQALTNKLTSMIMSGNEQSILAAAQMYAEVKGFRNDRGVAIGQIVLRDIPDKDKALFEAVDTAISLRIPLQDAVSALVKSQGKPEYQTDNLIGQYDENQRINVSGGTKFYDRMQADFKTVVKSPVAYMPPDAQALFKELYRTNYIVTGDMELAWSKSVEFLKTNFQKSNVFSTGYVIGAPLTNPSGYDAKFSSMMGARDTSYEWLNENVRDHVSDDIASGKIKLPMDPATHEPMTPDAFRSLLGSDTGPAPAAPGYAVRGNQPAPDQSAGSYDQFNWLGKTGVLVPVAGSNPDKPEFKVHMIGKNGEQLGPLLNADGSTYVVTPYLDRDLAINKDQSATQLETLKTEEAAVQNKLDSIWDSTLNQLPTEVQGSYDPSKETRAEFIARVAPELSTNFDNNTGALLEGFDARRKELEKQLQITIPQGNFDKQTFLVPGAAGKDVSIAAAMAVDEVLPDGTGGVFLSRVASQESRFGTVDGTFRTKGDIGITQVNDGTLRFLNKEIASGQGRVYQAAVKLQDGLGIDLTNVTPQDLHKPIISMAMARLKLVSVNKSIPQDAAGQAMFWKTYYNTYLGRGTTDEFMQNAGAVPDDLSGFTKASYSPGAEDQAAGALAIPGIRYTNQGAKRNLPVVPRLQTSLVSSVQRVLGPGYTVEVFSGGQSPGKSRGMTGTGRHGDEEASGLAADVYIYGPDGKKVRDPASLSRLADFWVRSGIGSAGTFMTDYGLHLDLITRDKLKPGQSLRWYYGNGGRDA